MPRPPPGNSGFIEGGGVVLGSFDPVSAALWQC